MRSQIAPRSIAVYIEEMRLPSACSGFARATLLGVVLPTLMLPACPTAPRRTPRPLRLTDGTHGKPLVVAVVDDARLSARIERCWPLRYTKPPAADADVPAFVRAASGLCATTRGLVAVQDDVLALARLTPPTTTPTSSPRAEALLLPRGKDGRRVFDTAAGNRSAKPDFEACVTLHLAGVEHAVGIPSGSKMRRSRIALARVDGQSAPRLFDGRALYERFDALRTFSGSRLNIEGVARIGKTLRFYQRGNTRRRRGLDAISASVELSRESFERWLLGQGALPTPGMLRRYALGAEQRGARWGFTDALGLSDGRVLVLASAEATSDAGHDGAILGSRLGVDDGQRLRWTTLYDPDGKPTHRKTEGLAPDALRRDRFWIATDPDAHATPAELCLLRVSGL